ncbi:MAG: O-antigen ligase family protein [Bacteroidota bacterium]
MKFEKIYMFALIFMVSFWIPFPKLSSPAIAVFGLVVIHGSWKQKLRFQFNWILLAFVTFYFLYCLYCISSQHMDKAMDYLEYKLSFLIFPILFSFRPTFDLERKNILASFVMACLVLSLFYVGQASFHYLQSGDINYFQSSAFATNHHPSYVAAFLSFSIYILIRELRDENDRTKRLIYFIIIGFFTLLHFPLTSLAGILLLFLLYAFLFIKWAWINWNKWQFGLMVIAGMIAIQVLFVLQPSLKRNITFTAELASNYLKSPSDFIKSHPETMSGNQARLVIWTITCQIISEHPMGVGLGNLEEEMQHKLDKLKQRELMEKNYNPHNQFLQITAEIGVIGLLLFTSILWFTCRFAWKRKDDLLLFLALSLVLNSLFESMLQRQSGIVFYTMLICLFVHTLPIFKAKNA